MDALTSYLPVTFDKFRSSTENDTLLQTVEKFIMSHLPDLRIFRQHAEWSQLEGFYSGRESLLIEQGCVPFRERVIISSTLRTKVIHQGHPGSSE
jgi:hypothetical protein